MDYCVLVYYTQCQGADGNLWGVMAAQNGTTVLNSSHVSFAGTDTTVTLKVLLWTFLGNLID